MTDLDINVLFADDHSLFRKTVRGILESAPDIHIVGEAEDGTRALADLQAGHADVAILDLDMPGKDGLEVARSVRDQHLPVKTVLLTAHKSAALVARALECGVSGYVLKDDLAEIIDCVRAVYAGKRYLSPQLAAFNPNRRK